VCVCVCVCEHATTVQRVTSTQQSEYSSWPNAADIFGRKLEVVTPTQKNPLMVRNKFISRKEHFSFSALHFTWDVNLFGPYFCTYIHPFCNWFT